MKWFGGLNVLTLESRRAEEMAALIAEYAGNAVVAPSMREQKLDLSGPLAAFEKALLGGEIHALVCMAGVGTRLFLRELAARDPQHLARLQQLRLMARGTKTLQALAEVGLVGQAVGKPHTWQEVQEGLLTGLERDQHAVILEYGDAAPAPMLRELGFAGLRVTSIPVYRTAFPFDTAPLAQAVRDVILGGPDVLLLSSGTQALHFLKYAEKMGLLEEARAALNRLVVVSIGPACSEAAADLGIRIDLEADPHKMGALVRCAAEHAPALLAARQLERAG